MITFDFTLMSTAARGRKERQAAMAGTETFSALLSITARIQAPVRVER